MSKNIARTSISWVLGIILVAVTVIVLLGIWGYIDFERFLERILSSFAVIFVASAIALFIFGVVMKDNSNDRSNTPPPL